MDARRRGLDNLLDIIHACGFELPLELVARDDAVVERLRKNVLLSPERRVQRILQTRAKQARLRRDGASTV